MLTILTVPNETLRAASKPIRAIDKKMAQFLHALGLTLQHKDDPPGVGVSAVQVGKSIAAFYTYMDPDPTIPSSRWSADRMELTLFVNPTIVATSKATSLGGSARHPQLEGCLSIPRLWGPVLRHEWIEVSFLTLKFGDLTERTTLGDLSETTVRFEAFPARVVQHEIDHLKGVLFTDYMKESDLPLYLEEDNELVRIKDPGVLLTW